MWAHIEGGQMHRWGADVSKGGRHIEGGQTYRLGTGLTVGRVYQQWDGRINGGMGVSMVGWAY